MCTTQTSTYLHGSNAENDKVEEVDDARTDVPQREHEIGATQRELILGVQLFTRPKFREQLARVLDNSIASADHIATALLAI
mgnify:CR=1 FL=1